MRGVLNCDLTVTDLIGEDTSGGERNLSSQPSLRDGHNEEVGDKLSRCEETALAESAGRSLRETVCDLRRICPEDCNKIPVALRNDKFVAISSLRLVYDEKDPKCVRQRESVTKECR